VDQRDLLVADLVLEVVVLEPERGTLQPADVLDGAVGGDSFGLESVEVGGPVGFELPLGVSEQVP